MSTSEPFLLVQLSDVHVHDDDAEPERLFADAVRDVAALRPAAVLVTGDLTDHGHPGEYERRERLRAAFPLLDDDVAGEDYRYAARCGPLRIVAVDTTDPGRVEGRLGPERLAWLDARLAEEPETPTIVAMHHPPLLLGIPVWDAIGLSDADRAALGEVVAGRGHVRRIVAGHVHRAAVGSVGGCPVFTCPATWLQGRLDFAHPNELSVVAEPPGFAVHVTVGGELTSHVQPVGAW